MTEYEFRSGVVALLRPVVDHVVTDETPKKAPFPHVVLVWGITHAPGLQGDARTLAYRGEFQATLREKAEVERSGAGTFADVLDALDGATVGRARLMVRSAPRQVDPTDAGVVRRIITVGHVIR